MRVILQFGVSTYEANLTLPPNAKPESEGSDSGFPFEQLVVTTNPVTQGLLRWAIVKRLEANLFLLRSVIIFSEGLFYGPSLIGNAKRLK